MIFGSGFAPSRDPKKVYQATHDNWVNYNKTDSYLLRGGPGGVYDNYGTVAEQLLEAVHNVITFSSDIMCPFLAAMGVKTEDMSPFCHKFTSLRDLHNAFIRYFPNSFIYEVIVGGGLPDATVNLESYGSDVIT